MTLSQENQIEALREENAELYQELERIWKELDSIVHIARKQQSVEGAWYVEQAASKLLDTSREKFSRGGRR